MNFQTVPHQQKQVFKARSTNNPNSCHNTFNTSFHNVFRTNVQQQLPVCSLQFAVASFQISVAMFIFCVQLSVFSLRLTFKKQRFKKNTFWGSPLGVILISHFPEKVTKNGFCKSRIVICHLVASWAVSWRATLCDLSLCIFHFPFFQKKLPKLVCTRIV